MLIVLLIILLNTYVINIFLKLENLDKILLNEMIILFFFVVLTYFNYQSDHSIINFILLNTFIIIGFIDYRCQLIYDVFIYFIIILAVINFIIDPQTQVNIVTSLLIPYIFILINLVKYSIGMGDIKLLIAMNLLIGFRQTLMSLYCGLIICLLFIVIIKKEKKQNIAFVPFIAMGYYLVNIYSFILY